MIDIKLIRDNVEEVIKSLNTRGKDFSYLRDIITLDEVRRKKIVEVEELKNVRNEKSKLIGQLKREKKDVTEVLNSVSNIGDDIAKIDSEVKDIEDKINNILLNTPNLLHKSVPIGKDETENV